MLNRIMVAEVTPCATCTKGDLCRALLAAAHVGTNHNLSAAIEIDGEENPIMGVSRGDENSQPLQLTADCGGVVNVIN